MAQVNVIGRVTADFELQTSTGGNYYVRFSLAERLGYGERARTQYFQVWAWEEDAQRLLKRKVKKGSLLWVSGSLELTPYQKKDGETKDKALKLTLDNWGFVPTNKAMAEGGKASHHTQNSAESSSVQASPDGEIDGEREALPD